MKQLRIILILLPFLSLSCTSTREATQEEKQIKFVFNDVGLDKPQIFSKVAIWLAKNVQSSKDIIQLKDSTNGIIVAEGVINISEFVEFYQPCEYKITVEIKDGRFRLTYEQFICFYGVKNELREPVLTIGLIKKIREVLTKSANQLNEFVKNDKNDTW